MLSESKIRTSKNIDTFNFQNLQMIGNK